MACKGAIGMYSNIFNVDVNLKRFARTTLAATTKGGRGTVGKCGSTLAADASLKRF